ncbi:MAG: DUF2808 domain-containing protein [Synechococcus sp.]
MTDRNSNAFARPLRRIGLMGGLAAAGLLGAAPLADVLRPTAVQAQGTPSLLEFRWDSDDNYRKLYYFQSSTSPRDRAEYFLMLKPKDRKTAILKLNISVPEHFNARIKPNKVSLCVMDLGGMLARSRCKETLPATVEVNESGTSIDVFPETPIPTGGTVAVVIKLFNPSNTGMFQFNALAQAPGDLPVAGYLGSWLIDID